jgi:hypothetical protein
VQKRRNEPGGLVWKLSRHTSISGIDVAAFLVNRAEAKALFEKIEAALQLIEQCDPRRMAYLRRDVKRILVWGSLDYNGTWRQADAMCELSIEFVRSPKTTAAILAATLVHEAMHARLMRWGFGYSEPMRVRIEAMCIKASISFARRLPLSEMPSRGLIMWTSQQLLDRDAHFWSAWGRQEAKAALLVELGWPRWLVHLLGRIGAARIRRYERAIARRTEAHERRRG